jgi:hypothetical protein
VDGAVLACGDDARLSHQSGFSLQGLSVRAPSKIQVTVTGFARRHAGSRFIAFVNSTRGIATPSTGSPPRPSHGPFSTLRKSSRSSRKGGRLRKPCGYGRST